MKMLYNWYDKKNISLIFRWKFHLFKMLINAIKYSDRISEDRKLCFADDQNEFSIFFKRSKRPKGH